jgi:hypothetical protein
MLLDVILSEPDLIWLATSEEKMAHVSPFTAIAKDPREWRTFLERHVIFLAALPTWTVRVVNLLTWPPTGCVSSTTSMGPALALRRTVSRRPPPLLRNSRRRW